MHHFGVSFVRTCNFSPVPPNRSQPPWEASRYWNSTCLVAPKISKPLSFLVLVGLKVLEFKLPCGPQNIKTPIVSRTGRPPGTRVESAMWSRKYENPYRFSYWEPSRYWNPCRFSYWSSKKCKTPIVFQSQEKVPYRFPYLEGYR